MFVAVPPLTVDEVMSVLRGLAGKWREVGGELYISETTMNAIESEKSENIDRLRECIIYWLQWDPEASWRNLIFNLYKNSDEELQQTAYTIRKNAEKLSGQSMS